MSFIKQEYYIIIDWVKRRVWQNSNGDLEYLSVTDAQQEIKKQESRLPIGIGHNWKIEKRDRSIDAKKLEEKKADRDFNNF
jgi:hypothetical protein